MLSCSSDYPVLEIFGPKILFVIRIYVSLIIIYTHLMHYSYWDVKNARLIQKLLEVCFLQIWWLFSCRHGTQFADNKMQLCPDCGSLDFISCIDVNWHRYFGESYYFHFQGWRNWVQFDVKVIEWGCVSIIQADCKKCEHSEARGWTKRIMKHSPILFITPYAE